MICPDTFKFLRDLQEKTTVIFGTMGAFHEGEKYSTFNLGTAVTEHEKEDAKNNKFFLEERRELFANDVMKKILDGINSHEKIILRNLPDISMYEDFVTGNTLIKFYFRFINKGFVSDFIKEESDVTKCL